MITQLGSIAFKKTNKTLTIYPKLDALQVYIVNEGMANNGKSKCSGLIIPEDLINNE